MKMPRSFLLTLVTSAAALLAQHAHAGKTLDTVKSRGQLACGVNVGLAGFAAADSNHTILPQLISKEPLGPRVRRGDDEWFTITKWVVNGLQEAEEYGVTQANVDQLATSADPVVQRMLGISEDTGKLLGLDRAWLANAVRATGNYGEIFERHVGPSSLLGLPRGINNLWNKGGVVYPIPIR